jgi:hypothetical protein
VDYQFFNELPKEVPHGYTCAYIPDSSNPVCSIQQVAGGVSGMDADKQAWLAKYATGPRHDNTYSAPRAQTADQISAILRDQFGILPKRRMIGYTKPYPSDYDLIPQDGLSHSQKCRVQRLCTLEEAEAQYLETLRKARPDLAVKVHYTQKKESRPRKREWHPKPTKADGTTSAGTNMVFVLRPEFYAPDRKELPVAQLDFGPRPVIFEKPQEKNYKYLKALYLKGYINGHPVNKMLVDTGAAVNIMLYSVLCQLGHSAEDLIKANVALSTYTVLLRRLSQLLSSSPTARVLTLSCLGEIGFMPTAASLLRCTNV